MYCARCVTPNSRPNIRLDSQGVCNACRTHAQRDAIDWRERERIFRDLVTRAQARRRGYDCVIPVSGGKDSTWQVVRCLEYGLTPLAVTWKPPSRSPIGWRNLQNLIGLGVDHIDYQINPRTERKFLYQALVRYGATAIPMHLAMFNIPLSVAANFNIPLVIWGENSAVEYGSAADEDYGGTLDAAWLRRYGATHGTSARDWVSAELTERELTPYMGPSDEELATAGVHPIFLGHYFPWDPETSLLTACAHGFEPSADGPKTGLYAYADIDDDFISIHHYLKWYKFGFTRLFDNLSLEIRNGRVTRGEAVEIIRQKGDQTPHGDIDKFCRFVGIPRGHFFEVIERFRNPEVWTKRGDRWIIEGFLVPDWEWT